MQHPQQPPDSLTSHTGPRLQRLPCRTKIYTAQCLLHLRTTTNSIPGRYRLPHPSNIARTTGALRLHPRSRNAHGQPRQHRLYSTAHTIVVLRRPHIRCNWSTAEPHRPCPTTKNQKNQKSNSNRLRHLLRHTASHTTQAESHLPLLLRKVVTLPPSHRRLTPEAVEAISLHPLLRPR
jgi:hypothetical protein